METDVVILGAGAAGLMCALTAAGRGRRVLVVDHAPKAGGKILISGGGRCNFTNTGTSPAHFQTSNPHFAKSALSRYTPADFIALVQKHGVPFHEKKLGQLFCDRSAKDIVELLVQETKQAGAELRLNTRVLGVERAGESFRVDLADGPKRESVRSSSLVVATGGLSIPRMGATGFGYEIARSFGLKIIETAAALDGFTLSGADLELARELAGLSADCVMTAGGLSFRENLLFTHAGLSGPAALQASLHWRPGQEIAIDLLPDLNAITWLKEAKNAKGRLQARSLLGEKLPQRLADALCARAQVKTGPLAECGNPLLEALARQLKDWRLKPSGTVGYAKAEVTRGGVDTEELSSQTMEAKRVPGLYFIGEVVDVTGWLGGYNFQWAWASGWAAGQSV